MILYLILSVFVVMFCKAIVLLTGYSDARAGSLQDLLLQEPELLQLGRQAH